MSLKFGIYLVEQRIISPEQFCGLIKIQQETSISLANVALRRNLLTIKQVATILDELETNPSNSFQQIAVEMDLLDKADAAQLIQYQLESCTPIRTLAVECGLLTHRQTSVLYHHFERNPIAKTAKPAQPAPTPAPAPAPAEPIQTPIKAVSPPRPKFRSRPVIVHPYSTQ